MMRGLGRYIMDDPLIDLLRRLSAVENKEERAELVRVFGPPALVRSEIADLRKSSQRLECLTRWLIGLTAMLAVLTAVSIVQAFHR